MSSSAADVRETRPMPRPARAASRTAVLEPSVRIDGTSPRVRSHSSAIFREPEPGSRRSHGRPPSSSTATQRRLASGSSGAVTSTISLTPKASPTSRSSSGTRPGDGDVRAVLEQPGEDLGAVADVQVDVELRMAVAERADERRHDVVAGRGDGADAQDRPRAGGALARRAAALLEQAEDVRGVRREGAPRRRRPQPAAVALEQLGAHLALERGHRGAHRRLGDEELLGGRRDRAAAHHREERRQLGQGDGHEVSDRQRCAASAAAAPSPRARAPSSPRRPSGSPRPTSRARAARTSRAAP